MNDATALVGAMATKAMDLLIEAVEQTPPESWDQPSNLEDWNVRDVVGHATGSAAKIVTLIEDGEVWSRSEPAHWVCEDPAAWLRDLAARLRDALPSADLLSGARSAARAEPEAGAVLARTRAQR